MAQQQYRIAAAEQKWAGELRKEGETFMADDEDRAIRVLERLGRIAKVETAAPRRGRPRAAVAPPSSGPVQADYDRRDMQPAESSSRPRTLIKDITEVEPTDDDAGKA